MENAKSFLDAVGINKLDDAIAFAIKNSEQIGDMRWMGQFGSGTFYCDSDGSHWFEDMTPYEAKLALSQQYLETLTG